uniref:Putative salivary kunitz domain protein n=1 Tax=Ixodes ricinus TaxID=34613 RepID=A0A147BFJ1_IXORI
MKATLVAICFIAAVAYSMGRLTEQQCRAPVPYTSCAPNTQPRTVYTFRNHTNKCEPMKTCAEGVNLFEKPECCKSECPYGKHSKTSSILIILISTKATFKLTTNIARKFEYAPTRDHAYVYFYFNHSVAY